MNATRHHGALPLVFEGPDELEGDDGTLDAVRFSVLVSSEGSGWRANLAAAGYGRKAKLSGWHSMWVRSVSKAVASGITAEVAVEAVGLIADDEKRARVIGTGSSQIAVGPFEKVVLVVEDEEAEDPEGGTAPAKRRVPKVDAQGEIEYQTIAIGAANAERWTIKDAFVTVTDTYFVADVLANAPATNVIGTAMTPPNAPTPPANPWDGYQQPLRGVFPNGWVLDDRQISRLFVDGSEGLWQVTDTFGFYYAAVPD